MSGLAVGMFAAGILSWALSLVALANQVRALAAAVDLQRRAIVQLEGRVNVLITRRVTGGRTGR